jgi:hypothetical protein
VARLRLLTDNHVRQPIIEALRTRGWDAAAFTYAIEYIKPER